MTHICEEEGNHQHTLPAVLYQKLFQVTVDEVGNWSHKKSPSLTLIFFFAQNKLGPGISLLLLQAFFLNEYAWYLCYHNAEKILWLFTTMKTLLQKMLDVTWQIAYEISYSGHPGDLLDWKDFRGFSTNKKMVRGENLPIENIYYSHW